jgi:hypothetical protein
MKKIELQQLGVQEMNTVTMRDINGGWSIANTIKEVKNGTETVLLFLLFAITYPLWKNTRIFG